MLFNDLCDFSRTRICTFIYSSKKLDVTLCIDSIARLRAFSLPYINTAQAFKVPYLALGKARQFCCLANTHIKLISPIGRFIVYVLQYLLEKVFHRFCSLFDETVDLFLRDYSMGNLPVQDFLTV